MNFFRKRNSLYMLYVRIEKRANFLNFNAHHYLQKKIVFAESRNKKSTVSLMMLNAPRRNLATEFLHHRTMEF